MSIRPDNFSRNGLRVLFDYLSDIEADCGEDMELDVIAICCDFSEDTFEGIASAYDIDLSDVNEDDISQAIMDYLCDNTHVVGQTDSGFVYANF